MKIVNTSHPDVFELIPRVFCDDRGFFMESYNKKKLQEIGIDYDFVQDNHSSSLKGTLRGLHFQINHTQGKLIRVVKGKVFDVAVDLRKSSPYFGKWVGIILSSEKKNQIWIPPKFAHGFYTLSNTAEVFYKATDYYDPDAERCILWNDPQIGIEWPNDKQTPLILSEKDRQGSFFNKDEVFK